MDHRTRRPLIPAEARPALIVLLVLAMMSSMLAGACGRSPADLAGTYTAGDADVRMELKATGKGALSTPEDDISFTWERRGDEVWLHTRGGGVVVCTLGPDGSLATDMPGVGNLRFTRR